MGQGLSSFDSDARALMSGLLIGDIIYVNGTSGDNNSSGLDWSHALRDLQTANQRTVSAHNDYILAAGTITAPGILSLVNSDLHIIGVGDGLRGCDSVRGCIYTCPATVDTIELSTAADRVEIAGIRFNCNATDGILIDDAAVDGGFFHHNTVYGSTTASVAIRLDLEGANWTVNDNHFILCKLPIDTAGAFQVIRRNIMTDVAASAKGIVIGAASHYSIIESNIINMTVGTGEVGITIASSADSCIIAHNWLNAADPISDSGTSTAIYGNFTNAVTGTSGASIPLVVIT